MESYIAKLKYLVGILALVGVPNLYAVQPYDVIINELYFPPLKPKGKGPLQAVELLVVKEGLNLNGLQVSDRMLWNVPAKDQCTLQDLGRGFLEKVPSGTLIVIYNGKGKDDTNADDFVLTFYAQSSLFCNVAPSGSAFHVRGVGNGFHLLHLNRQVDFVKFRASDATHKAPADPGKLNWENGVNGHVDVKETGQNLGIRFLGNKPDLNDYPAAWMPYSDKGRDLDTLGKPNGGLNTDWIEELRAKSSRQ